MSLYTMGELSQCAEREVKMRRLVYSRRVENGQMTQKLADREIEMMEHIASVLRELAQKELLL